MVTITDLESNTSGSSSMGIINTNFDNLNTYKIEADSVDTLENKSIDADDNTITNLGTAEFATASKTGLDTKVVTGTKGTAENLAKWNTDGDAVDAGVALETTLTASDTKVPTSQAVKTYVDNSITTKTILLKHGYVSTGSYTELNGYSVMSLSSGAYADFTFVVPADFTSFVNLKAVMIPDTTETINYDVSVVLANDGETNNTATSSDTGKTQAVTINLMTYVDIGVNTNITALFATLSAGDIVSVKYTSNTTLVRLLGLVFKYA